MEWNKYTIKTTVNAVDYVSGILMNLGITGMEIDDENEPAKVSFYLEVKDTDINPSLINNGISIKDENISEMDEVTILLKLSEQLERSKQFMNIGEGTIEKSVTRDVDWMNKWKDYVEEFTVGDILIKPAWNKNDENQAYDDIDIEAEDKEKILTVVYIDSGNTFGSGTHETTKLCIPMLRDNIFPGAKVLDVGCGSGILSVIAAKLGAGEVVGTDIDPNAIQITMENAKRNTGCEYLISAFCGNILQDQVFKDKLGYECYDIIVANILADVIVQLAGIVTEFMKPGACFITSGIIRSKEDEVVSAITSNEQLTITNINHEGDWVSIVAKKK